MGIETQPPAAEQSPKNDLKYFQDVLEVPNSKIELGVFEKSGYQCKAAHEALSYQRCLPPLRLLTSAQDSRVD